MALPEVVEVGRVEKENDFVDVNISSLKELAESGDASAQSTLATSYAIGDGVEANLVLARYWYSKAAEQGDADASFNLASMVLLGEGGAKSSRKAGSLMRKASCFGSSDASIWIGETAMRNGQGDVAITYFTRALAQGDLRGARGISLLLADSQFGPVKKWGSLISEELKRSGVVI
ncbi:tetratricopeptide repeat protein [Xanthomonas sp. NCPPB 2654]|uniref:tetratricopeptide repeat protein n=1 Tax=unclassified Xanthomonas TaxID=2643310 RepID=UPI0021DFF9A5|nr:MULTISPECIES: tetratricopeptide repeat protein [unclassified Xanthomonas]MDL5367281.1 tetratricopeptide repeat protein [Xanthomonas sp. NCPPB 2654]UYC19596.1 sel1 repeat family protein [Xanthomonas sp. CFBP 8443]